MLHLVAVTHTAITLAAIHNHNIEHAALAGLIHDQSKEMHPKDILADLKRRGYPLPPEDLDFPSTWHGLHAALLAQLELGIFDPEVIEAVTLHTTADAGVGQMTKIIFIADLCEPTRNIQIGPQILEAARRNLDDGFRLALLYKLRHVVNKKRSTVHPRAVRALRAYLGLEPEALVDKIRL